MYGGTYLPLSFKKAEHLSKKGRGGRGMFYRATYTPRVPALTSGDTHHA